MLQKSSVGFLCSDGDLERRLLSRALYLPKRKAVVHSQGKQKLLKNILTVSGEMLPLLWKNNSRYVTDLLGRKVSHHKAVELAEVFFSFLCFSGFALLWPNS